MLLGAKMAWPEGLNHHAMMSWQCRWIDGVNGEKRQSTQSCVCSKGKVSSTYLAAFSGPEPCSRVFTARGVSRQGRRRRWNVQLFLFVVASINKPAS